MITTSRVFQEKYVRIHFDVNNKILIAKWNGRLQLDEVKRGCSLMRDFIAENAITKHMSNHTHLKMLSEEVQKYLAEEWFPEVYALGLRKVGVIVTEDLFAQTTVLNVNMKAQQEELAIHTFYKVSDCLEWLNNT
jgi:hypothetical protein